MEDFTDLRTLDHLVQQLPSVQGDHAHVDRVLHELKLPQQIFRQTESGAVTSMELMPLLNKPKNEKLGGHNSTYTSPEMIYLFLLTPSSCLVVKLKPLLICR